MENRINSLLANNIQKEEKKELRRFIEIGKNFSIIFSKMTKEEQEKIISYCFEFSDKESQILADIFELYEV